MKNNFFLIYIFSIISIIILFVTDTIIDKAILLVLFLLLNLINKSKISFRFLSFAVYLTIFIVVFNFIIFDNLRQAYGAGLETFLLFLNIWFISLFLKNTLTNKQLAYCITKTLMPLKTFGFNENKFYTIILLVLNQIYTLVSDAREVYDFARVDSNATTFIEKFKLIIYLITPFIFTSLKRNKIITVSIINKGFTMNQKLKYINYGVISNKLLMSIFVIFVLELLIIGGVI